MEAVDEDENEEEKLPTDGEEMECLNSSQDGKDLSKSGKDEIEPLKFSDEAINSLPVSQGNHERDSLVLE